MKLTYKILIGLIVIILLVGLILLIIPNNKQQKTIKIGYKSHIGYLPLFVGVEKGYFDEQNLEVIPVKFESTDLIVRALLSKELDALIGINTLTAFSVEQQSPGRLKIFTTQTYTTKDYPDQILVHKDSNIVSIKDLKNKKIALMPDSSFLKFFEIILEKNGLSLEDVKIVQLEPNLQLQALASKSVDAILSMEPLGTMALEKDIAKSICDAPFAKYIMNPFPIAVGVIPSDFISENPDETEKLILATNKAVDFIQSNPEEAKAIASKWTNMPLETSLKLNLNKFERLEEADKDQIQKVADFYYEIGLLENKVKVSDMFIK